MDIKKLIDTDYLTETRNNRRGNGQLGKLNKKTQEFFSPSNIVEKMCNLIPEEDWRDPHKTFFESSCGNGNFLLMMIFRRINSGIDWQTTLSTLYAIDLMPDNISEAKQRVHELLRNIAPDYSPKIADEIMDKNFIAHDFFTWDFENWCEKKEEPKKPKKKIKKTPKQLEIEFE